MTSGISQIDEQSRNSDMGLAFISTPTSMIIYDSIGELIKMNIGKEIGIFSG